MIGEVVDIADGDLEVGMALTVGYRRVDDDLTLPVWRPAT